MSKYGMSSAVLQMACQMAGMDASLMKRLKAEVKTVMKKMYAEERLKAETVWKALEESSKTIYRH